MFPPVIIIKRLLGLRGAETMEPTAQIGRGQVGLQASFYQTYELIPIG